MHRPPAISFSVLRSSRFGALLLTVGVLSFGALPWAVAAGFDSLRLSVVGMSWLLSVAALWLCWRKQPVGLLQWDGERWYWSGSAASLRAVAIQFDFQSSLWLTLRTQEGRRRGLWLDEDPRDAAHWRALRRALVGTQVAPAATRSATPDHGPV